MAGQRTPGPLKSNRDHGTRCRSQTIAPGPVGHDVDSAKLNCGVSIAPEYSYSISGATGPFGGMFLTEAMKRLPGTWYDRTDAINQLRQNEVILGSSKFASPEFRRMAKRITVNLERPGRVSVDVFFQKEGTVETIEVRGRTGIRTFRFDIEEARISHSPKGDAFQPFHDAIAQLIALIKEVR